MSVLRVHWGKHCLQSSWTWWRLLYCTTSICNYRFVGRSICILYLTWRHWVPPQPVPQTGVLFGSASSNCSGNHLQLSWDSRGGKKGNKNQKFPVLYPITCCTYKTPFLSSGCFKNSLTCPVTSSVQFTENQLGKLGISFQNKNSFVVVNTTWGKKSVLDFTATLLLTHGLTQFLRTHDNSPTGKPSPTVIVVCYYTRFSFIFLTLYIITDIISRSLLIISTQIHSDIGRVCVSPCS